MENTLTIDKESLVLDNHESIIKDITVTVNGNDNTENYRPVSNVNWIKPIIYLNNERKFVCRLFIDANTTIYDRSGTVTFVHNFDDLTSASLTVSQPKEKMTVTVGMDNIMLKSVYDNTDEYGEFPEIVRIPVSVTGGNGKFFVKGIRKYTEENELIAYDNGLLIRTDENNVIIVNNGRVSMDDSFYYRIFVSHSSNSTVTATIDVRYDVNLVTYITTNDSPDYTIFERVGRRRKRSISVPKYKFMFDFMGGIKSFDIKRTSLTDIRFEFDRYCEDWLNVELNPQKILFVVNTDYRAYDKLVNVTVYDGENVVAVVEVSQSAFSNFSMEVSENTIYCTQKSDGVGFEVSCVGGEMDFKIVSCPEWITVHVYEESFSERLKTYYLDLLCDDNNEHSVRSGEIVLQHLDNEDVTCSVNVKQGFSYGDETEFVLFPNEVELPYNSGTYSVKCDTFPDENSKIYCNYTSLWCNVSVSPDREIVFKFSTNPVMEERKFMLTLFTEEYPENIKQCIIKQKEAE